MITATSASQTTPQKIRALIVDDQLIQRHVLRLMLRNETDIEIIGVSETGREAVASINELNPDLVFMDVQMPDLDGFGVVSEIGPARMPNFIFVTANDKIAQRASELNAVDYILKPCTRARFQDALQRARAKIRRQSELAAV